MGRARADGQRIVECKRPDIYEFGSTHKVENFPSHYCRGKEIYEHKGYKCQVRLVSNMTGAQSYVSKCLGNDKYQTEDDSIYDTGVFTSKIKGLVWWLNWVEHDIQSPNKEKIYSDKTPKPSDPKLKLNLDVSFLNGKVNHEDVINALLLGLKYGNQRLIKNIDRVGPINKEQIQDEHLEDISKIKSMDKYQLLDYITNLQIFRIAQGVE